MLHSRDHTTPGSERPGPDAAGPAQQAPAVLSDRTAVKPGAGGTGGSGPSTAASLRGVAGRSLFFPEDLVAGRWRIVRFIARGGMGEVYEAEDQELRERVALKVLRLDVAMDPRIEERFRREIQLARRVTHPNVCRILDSGWHVLASAEGPAAGEARVLFLTMELLQGETLSARLKRSGGLLEEDALPIVRQIAAALDAAHQAGVIHRDLKSSNVLLVPAGERRAASSEQRAGTELAAQGSQLAAAQVRAVVTDFGLARTHGAEDSAASVSSTEAFLGTPAYMAPEQVEGTRVGPAADIYALGVVLYEMVTGRWPFEGETLMAIAVKRLTEPPPPPSTHVPTLDPRWERTILRCMQRYPGLRFPTAAAALQALESNDWSPEEPVSEKQTGSRGRAPWRVKGGALAAAALLLLLFVGGLGLHSRFRAVSPAPKPPAAAAQQRRSVAVLGFRNLGGRAEWGWLSMALAEMLGAEIAAGEVLRLVPGADVARMKAELHLDEEAAASPETLGQIGRNLGAELLVLGAYQAGEGNLRLDLRIVEAHTAKTLGTLSGTGPEGDLLEMVARAGLELREKLGSGRGALAEGGGARSAVPHSAEVMRLYAEGLEKLRHFDALGAQESLEKAAAGAPGFPLVHLALSEAWGELGYAGKALAEAELAFQRAREGQLPREEQLRVEGHLREASEQWAEASEIYRTLFGFFPDRVDYGLKLGQAQIQRGRTEEAAATLQALRSLPAPAAEDPRVDLFEGDLADAKGDYPGLQAAMARAAERAAARGAPMLQASALTMEAWAWVFLNQPGRGLQAAETAMRLATESGDAAGIADALEAMHPINSQQGRHTAAAGKSREAARIALRMGNKTRAVEALYNTIFDLLTMGDAAGARAVLSEIEGIGLEPGDQTNAIQVRYLRGWLRGEEGDAARALEDLEAVLADWTRRGNQRKIASAHRRLGDVLTARGDLEAARRHFEEALRIAEGVKLDWYIAQFQQALAAFELEAGRPAEAERLGRVALGAFEKVGAADRRVHVHAVLALALQARGQPAAAQAELGRALALEGELDNVLARVQLAAAALKVRGSPEDVRRGEEALAEATRHGATLAALRARLALGRHDLRSGRTRAGTARLKAVAQEASEKGLGLFAQEAAER